MTYGFSNCALALIENYFQRRGQQVKIGKHISSSIEPERGVPQGSVLRPFFFLVFINDLASFLKDIFTKHDTTMAFSAKTLKGCIDAARIGISLLITWCEYNQLYINWSKTFFMFTTNRRTDSPHVPLTLPTEIKCNGIVIQVVDSFRLLGITLDIKLNFVEHASNIAAGVKKKLFAIKRIFYLSREVKLQFLKVFILPCFDFGMTLMMYYSQTAINILTKSFYNAIYHILRIDCASMDVTTVDELLAEFNLTSFQQRVFMKFATFGFNMKFARRAPEALKAMLHYTERPEASMQNVPHQGLRTSTFEYITPDRGHSSFADHHFKNFYATMINKNDDLRNLYIKHDKTFHPLKSFPFTLLKFDLDLRQQSKQLLKKHLDIFPQFKTTVKIERTKFLLNRRKPFLKLHQRYN